MKKRIFYTILIFILSFGAFITNSYAAYDTAIIYETHVQNIGWQGYVYEEKISGTEGKSLRLEAIKLALVNPSYTGNIEYKTHIQNIGWENEWHKNDETSGTEGKSLRLEAIQIRLTGLIANYYDIYYRVHVENIGWMNWVKNGEIAGTEGRSLRLESIQIKLVKNIVNPTPQNIDVTSISLNRTSATIKQGENLKLTATILPNNATNKNIIWKSSNESVATVDANGLVSAVNPGIATIEASNGNVKTQAIVTVIGISNFENSVTYSDRTVLKKYTLTDSNKLFSVSNSEGCGSAQGFAVANKNIITVQKNGDDSKTVVSLYSPSGTLINRRVSKFGHGNSATYNSKTGIFYVTNLDETFWSINYANFSNGGKMNPNKITIDKKISGIAYDTDRNLFYAKKGKLIYIYDTNFRYMKEFSTIDGYTNQDLAYYHGMIIDIRYGKTAAGNVVNYLDLYRVSDYKYIGSYKIIEPSSYKNKFELESIDYSGYGNKFYLYYNYWNTNKGVVFDINLDL